MIAVGRQTPSAERTQNLRGRLLVHIDPASVELVPFVPATGLAVLRIEGRYPGWRLSATMLVQGIAAHVRSRVPEVRDVHNEIDGTPTDE